MFVIKWEDLEKLPYEKRSKFAYQSAKRAAKAAGLIEQVESVNTEYDAITALANFEVNFYQKGYSVMKDWDKAFYEKCRRISPLMQARNLYYNPSFTVGEYLKSQVSKP